MAKITGPQKALLRKFMITDPPPTKSSASNLISFIIHGNGAGNFTGPEHRANYFKREQKKYTGKRVVDTVPWADVTETIVVQYLSARSRQFVCETRSEITKPHPLTATIRITPEEGKPRTVVMTMGRLELFEETH